MWKVIRLYTKPGNPILTGTLREQRAPKVCESIPMLVKVLQKHRSSIVEFLQMVRRALLGPFLVLTLLNRSSFLPLDSFPSHSLLPSLTHHKENVQYLFLGRAHYSNPDDAILNEA